jgi:branched-chain amino acid transport system permease protein
MADTTVADTPAVEPAPTAPDSANLALVKRDVRLFASPWGWAGMAVLAVIWFAAPFFVNTQWATVLSFSGIIAIAALGLNLLTGYAGQASLGTAAFMAIGAFIASYMGRATDARVPGMGQPFTVYLVVAIVVGAVVGFVVGLPALRLRGNYLVVVTLGLVFITIWVIDLITRKDGVTVGVAPPETAEFLGIDWGNSFNFFGMREPTFFGEYRYQGLMYLSWGFVAVVALLVKNIVRSRPGRALQAIRERDVAAEVVGVSLFRYKVGAFVVSSAIGATAGVLYGLHVQFLKPSQEEGFASTIGLLLSILVLTVIVVGGIGSVYGTIIGALIIGSLPAIIGQFADVLPFIAAPGESGLSAPVFSSIVSAVLLVGTLVIEPFGVAGTVRKLKVRRVKGRADASVSTPG